MQNTYQSSSSACSYNDLSVDKTYILYVCKLVSKKWGIQCGIDNKEIINLTVYLTNRFLKHCAGITKETLDRTVIDHIEELLKQNNPLVQFILNQLKTTKRTVRQMSPLTPALESEGSVKRRRMGNLPSSLMFSDSEMKQYSNQMEEYVSQFRLIYHELFHLSKCKKGCSSDSYCRWFKSLLEHSKTCDSHSCYNHDCRALRVTIAHISSCTNPRCSWCFAGRSFHNDMERSHSLKSKYLPSRFNFMSNTEIDTLLQVIQMNSSPWWKQSTLRHEISRIHSAVKAKDVKILFHYPVRTSEYGCSRYYQIIKKPIDLETIEKKNARSFYRSVEAFNQDMNLMFDNCLTFNKAEDIIQYTLELRMFFNDLMEKLRSQDFLLSNQYQRVQSHHICSICRGGDYLLEGQSIHCSGDCREVIEVDKHYYLDIPSQRIWCEPCYRKLESSFQIEEVTIKKAALVRRLNKQNTKEGWVCCDNCKQWYHQVCVLFNTKLNEQYASSLFHCPFCIKNNGENMNNQYLRIASPRVKDLLECDLSRFIENRVYRLIHSIRQKRASELNCSIDNIEYPVELSVRVVVNSTESLGVDDSFLQYFKTVEFPEEIPYHVKCICLFQTIHNMDVLLFIMYVYECPENTICNYKTAYISYLDSVRYLTPSSYRKVVYQEVVLSYIAYIKQQGYNSVHLWVCPPRKGDDYIIFSHPPEQRTPSVDHLQKWYMGILTNGHNEGIIEEVTNMVDEYMTGKFRRSTDDMCALFIPRFYGDNWIQESEAKCKELVSSHKHQEEIESDASDHTACSSTLSVGKKVKKPRGELITSVYGSIKDYKIRLLVVKLQHQCQQCGKYVAEEDHYLMERFIASEPQKKGSKKSLQMQPYICMSCFETLSLEERGSFQFIRGVHYDTTDLNPVILSRVFENRQTFLSVCGSNHLQFDQLRRAMYSTMMILYYCTDPTVDVTKYTCNQCETIILKGKRWHCPICHDFDLCEKCKGLYQHEHDLIPYDVATVSCRQDYHLSVFDNRPFALQLLSLNHCFSCESVMCGIPMCPMIKGSVKHYQTCSNNSCKLCQHVESLIVSHVKHCSSEMCKVPHDILRNRFTNVL